MRVECEFTISHSAALYPAFNLGCAQPRDHVVTSNMLTVTGAKCTLELDDERLDGSVSAVPVSMLSHMLENRAQTSNVKLGEPGERLQMLPGSVSERVAPLQAQLLQRGC